MGVEGFDGQEIKQKPRKKEEKKIELKKKSMK